MIRALIIDDHPLISIALESIFVAQHGTECEILSIVDGKEVLAAIKKSSFDLVILDIFLPDIDTQDLLHQILRIRPNTKVLIHSSGNEAIYALHYVKQGAFGFVSKSASRQKLTRAINTVMLGKKYLAPRLMELLIDSLNGKKSKNPFANLSKREMEVAKLLSLGKGISEIANILNTHTSTVGTQKSRLLKKLNVNNLKEFGELSKLHGFVESVPKNRTTED